MAPTNVGAISCFQLDAPHARPYTPAEMEWRGISMDPRNQFAKGLLVLLAGGIVIALISVAGILMTDF